MKERKKKKEKRKKEITISTDQNSQPTPKRFFSF